MGQDEVVWVRMIAVWAGGPYFSNATPTVIGGYLEYNV